MEQLRNKKVIQGLLKEIHTHMAGLASPIKIMEVCGTHTMTIHRYGLKALLAEAGVEMLSGPGCPVCITPNAFHEAAIELVTQKPNLILTTFGDMTRVPTNRGALQTAIPAPGSRMKIVYSPQESLEIARAHPDKDVVFFGVGFETTIPSVAITARQAVHSHVSNYSVLSAFWLIPPPLKAIVESRDQTVQGFLYPGHVSAIIGEEPYRFIARDYGIPGSIAGFEPGDILFGITALLKQLETGRPGVVNAYTRVVRADGNPRARAIMAEILELTDASWRGLGKIPRSGLKFREEFQSADAAKKYGLEIHARGTDLPGCRCGDVLKGKIAPPECPLYGRTCRPDSPHGPCMVSFEGACLAHFKYGTRII